MPRDLTIDATESTEAENQSHGSVPGKGEMLGRYRVERELGRGGMGVVLAAHDVELERQVAIKLVSDRSHVREVDRIAREARAAARLSHPNVVQVFDVGVSDEGLAYIVMELIEGVTLSTWLESLPPRAEMLRVFAEAGRGLQAAHEAGLVHRDFKPANVLVDARGSAKVLDFGLARPGGDATPAPGTTEAVFSANATLTVTGIAVGTPAYMAPEQHREGKVTASADVYAFCVALYEALSGRRPFVAADIVGYYGLKRSPVPPIHPREPIPDALRDTIMRGLEFEAAKRPASVADVIRELDASRLQRASPWRWAAGIAIVGLATSGYLLRPVEPGDEAVVQSASAAPEFLDPAAESEANELCDRAANLAVGGHYPEALGVAYAALLVASSSGSNAARGCALRELGRSTTILHGRGELGQRYFEEAVDVLEQADAHEATVDALLIYASAAANSDSVARARVLQRRATAVADRYGLLGDTAQHVGILDTSARLATAEGESPVEFLEKALGILNRRPGVASPALHSLIEFRLGQTLLATDPARARALLESCERRAREFSKPTEPALKATRLLLAHAYQSEGDTEACIAAATRLIESLPEDDDAALSAATVKSICLCDAGRPDEAEKLTSTVLPKLRALPPSRARTEALHNMLQTATAVLAARDRLVEAEARAQESLVLAQSSPISAWYPITTAYYQLGNIADLRGESARAEQHYRRALEALGDRMTPVRPSLRSRLGVLLTREGRLVEARPLLEAEELPGNVKATKEEQLMARGYLARVWWELEPERRPEALRIVREVLDEYGAPQAPARDPAHAELEQWLRAHTN